MHRKLNGVHIMQRSGEFFGLCLLQLGNVSHRLWTQHIASPVVMDLNVPVIAIGPDSFRQLSRSTQSQPV